MTHLKHPSRQYTVGEVGLVAFRIVRKGGVILWIRKRFQSDKLLSHVGQDISLHDGEGDIIVMDGWFDAQNRPHIYGNVICSFNYSKDGK